MKANSLLFVCLLFYTVGFTSLFAVIFRMIRAMFRDTLN